MRVGWIGTGLMGLPMARRLVEAGHEVTAFNRTAARAEPLREAGAEIAATAADAAARRDVVFTMLAFPGDVREMYLGADGLVGLVEPPTVLVDMTTSAPALAREIAAAALDRGIHAVDAPVSGGVAGAEAGTLSVMVGGDDAVVEAVRPLFECLGAVIVHQGPPGAGQLTKLVNQVLIAGVTQGTCEAFALADAGGLDPDRVRQSVGAGTAGSRLFDSTWSKLRDHDPRPGFKLPHFIKDLGLVLDEADALDIELAATDLIRAAATSVVARLPGGGAQALYDAVAPGHFSVQT